MLSMDQYDSWTPSNNLWYSHFMGVKTETQRSQEAAQALSWDVAEPGCIQEFRCTLTTALYYFSRWDKLLWTLCIG